MQSKHTNTNTKTKKHGNRENDELSNVDNVVTSAKPSHFEDRLYIFEDNEAVIKMSIKVGSPTMRHVSRAHIVALDWLFDRINLAPKIQIKCVDTQNQLADLLTKGNFTRDEWNHLLRLFNIISFFCHFLQPFQINYQIQDHVEEAARRKTWRRGTSGGEIGANDESGIEDRKSVSNTGFGCI